MAKKSAKKQAKQKRQQAARERQRARSHAPSRTGEAISEDEGTEVKPQAGTQVRTTTAKLDQISLSNGTTGLSGKVSLSTGPSGLPNMGNTCYFNSVMQVLGQTYILHELLTERQKPDFQWDARTYYLNEKSSGKKYFASEQLNLKLSAASALELTFTKLQQEIFQRQRTNPGDLLREIRKVRSQFEGWSQQDSQELLISLLDSLKKEESKRQTTALIQGLKIANPKHATDEEKARARRFNITSKHTSLDAIFGGQLLSFIQCTVCNYRSFTFEHFMDLSLSLNLHPNNIPSQEMSSPKKANRVTVLTSSTTSKGGRKGNKKQQQQVSKVNNSPQESEEDDMPPMDSLVDSDETKDDESNNRNLTTKERKQRRMQKKAARREARKNVRDKAQKDQDKTIIEHLDSSENEDNEDGDDKENDALNINQKLSDTSFELKKERPEDLICNESESIELKSKDVEDININRKENIDNQAKQELQQPVVPDCDKFNKNSSSDLYNCVSSDDDLVKEIPLVNVYDSEELVFYGPDLPPPPPSPVHKSSDSDSGCGEDDEEDVDEGIDMVETSSQLPRKLEIQSTDGKLSSESDNANSPSIITADSDSGQDLILITNNKVDTCHERNDLLDSDQENTCSAVVIETANDSSDSSDSSLLSHIKPEFRSKFYDLAMQKMAYYNASSSQFDNRDLGVLFESFIKPEILDGANKYLCECCSKKNGGTKTYSKALRCQMIALPPPVLVVHLKRFETSGFGGRGRGFASAHKLNTSISFPERLNLSPYTSKIYESFAKFYEPDNDSDEADHQLDYQLYGVVIHSGGLRAGHYMAYVCVRPDQFYKDRLNRFLHLKPFVSNIEHILSVCYEKETQNGNECKEESEDKDEAVPNGNEPTVTEDTESLDSVKGGTPSSNRKWFFVSDSSVSPTSLENVLRDTTSPYLLFYERTC